MLDTNSSPEKQALLLALRAGVLRARLDANQLLTIGTALRNGWISPECAIAWLGDIGLVDQVIADEVQP